MSRAAKAAAAKDKTKPPPSTPVVAHEIVPGKFNENDWNIMLERDAAEDFVLDYLDEIMFTTMDTIHKRYIERQMLPFTITQAKDAILQIIEWRFLARDEGEKNMADSSWIQDEEPEAAVTDCWAQGSVPKTDVPAPSPISEEPEEEEVAAEEVQKAEGATAAPEEPELPDNVSEVAAEPEQVQEQRPDAKAKKVKQGKAKPQFKPYRGKLKSAGVAKMTESLDESEMKMIAAEIEASLPPQEVSSNLLTMPASCNSILKVQSGRPPGNKDVAYDEMGNVVSVMKLDADKLPTHRVTVKYQVVDPAVEAAQARLEAMRRGRYIAPAQPQLAKVRAKKSSSDTAATTSAIVLAGGKGIPKTRKPVYTQLPPSLIETMEVAAGVQVLEAGRSKKGPTRYVRKGDILEQHQKDLQPVTIRIKPSGVSVSDLLDRNTPILRPMQETPPLPPIVPQPPNGSSVKT